MRLTAPLPPSAHLWWATLVVCLAQLISGPAWAQDGTDSSATGEIIIYVFDLNGLPVEGVRVRQGGATVGATDAEGVLSLRLKPGDVSLSLQKDGFPSQPTPPIPVVAGRSTEIIVTYTKSRGDVDVEGPAGTGLSTTTATATGTVEGTVVDDEGAPVADARVFVRGAPIDARTNAQGKFTLENAPAQTLDLTVIHPEFSPTNRTVEVPPDETATVRIEVLPQAGFSQEFIVTIPKLEGGAVFVLAERRESSSVADLLGADQISKSGDSDAASALQRVTGITLVGGRYVYVRGLGERYSTTLLDGSTLPSPDPERRVVPLDLFPASILGSIVVQKTYSPDLPGEFGGGNVNLRTKAVPEDFFFNVSLSGAYRTESTFDTALGSTRGPTDFIGFGVAERTPVQEIQDVLDMGEITRTSILNPDVGFSDEELQRFGTLLDNDFGLEETTVQPDIGVGVGLGGGFDVFGSPAGILFGINYGQSWFAKESFFNQYGVGQMEGGRRVLDPNLSVRLLDLLNDINLGAIAVGSLDFDETNRIRLTTSLNRISEYSTRLQYGFTNENETRLNRIRWVEQQLFTAQLRGEHEKMFFTDLGMEWRYMFSTANRDEPNRLELTYAFEDQDAAGVSLRRGFYRLDEQDILNQRFFSELVDFNHDAGLDFLLPVPIFGEVESKLKAGLATVIKSRDVETRRLNYDTRVATGDFQTLPPDQIFNNDETFLPADGSQGVRLAETTLPEDSYRASQEVFAAYLMGDVGFSSNLRLLIGARAELSTQLVETFTPDDVDRENPMNPAELETFDLLPAATLTWEFVEDMQLRVAASRTLSRPNFRELSPSVFRDLGGTVEYAGNPELERTTITNADLRYEWYPSPGESFSASAFFKYFENPVEQTARSGPVTRFEPRNVPEAINVGGELETRIEFGWIDDFLADVYFAGNFTLVFSEVTIPEEDLNILTSAVRPLALQAPWVVNAQLGYDNPEVGLSASFLYNIFGPRIYAVGTLERPDIYEQPFDQLDFVLSWKFDRFKLQFKAQNLMDPVARANQTIRNDETDEVEDEQPVFRFRRGRRFGLGISVDLD